MEKSDWEKSKIHRPIVAWINPTKSSFIRKTAKQKPKPNPLPEFLRGIPTFGRYCLRFFPLPSIYSTQMLLPNDTYQILWHNSSYCGLWEHFYAVLIRFHTIPWIDYAMNNFNLLKYTSRWWLNLKIGEFNQSSNQDRVTRFYNCISCVLHGKSMPWT